jgi:hypothetical protein
MRSLLCAATVAVTLFSPPTIAQVGVIPGTGCPGAPPCDVIGVPRIGTMICFTKLNPPCPPGTIPFVIFGGPGPLLPIFPPLACSPPVPPGVPCWLGCDIVRLFAVPRLCLAIPVNAGLIGQCFCIQCGCFDPARICLELCQALRVCIMP